MSHYLKIDPTTGVAIGGVYQKIVGTDTNEWTNWVEVSDGAQVGWTWDSSAWVAPSDILVSLEEIRTTRDKMLLDSDWRVSVSDYPYTDTAAWKTYRGLLRDYPTTYTPVAFPTWPTPPTV